MRSLDPAEDIAPPFAPGPPTPHLPPTLLAAHDQIVADLRATQVAWRARPWPSRFAPLVAGIVVAGAPWALTEPRSSSIAGIVAVCSCLLAFIALATATQTPMRASTVGTVACVVAVAAVVLEGFSRGDPAVMKPPFLCILSQAAFFLPPAALVVWHVRRSHLPAQSGHAAAVGGVGLFGCALVWWSCLDGSVAHRVLEHSGGAVVLIAGCVALARVWLKRPRR